MNRLTDETSPYLRQHADNPVDWYPWGNDAFERAVDEDKPVLLSIGYSSCHWCHVMAHESFEDPDVAAVMNRLFVNVKVDREERPDVDAIYMRAVQVMTGRGGWPMTVFLTPDARPFYAGTYFPKADRGGMPGFVRVMEAVATAWRERRSELDEQAENLREAISSNALDSSGALALDPALLDPAYQGVRAAFEPRHGGFGVAPKFPHAMTLDFLLRAFVRNRAPETLHMVTHSLDAMAAGGIYDHLGGGFARYSTDETWLVPHFEKMLYDQALLVGAYLRGYLVTGELRYRRVVEETVAYVERDLRTAGGGLCSAEDADSEGIEGKFYLWDLDELTEVCDGDAPDVVRYFGVTADGNFVDPHTGYSGNILSAADRTEDRPAAVDRARVRLLERRGARVRPGLDDKVLLAWNALFVRSLAEAGAGLGRPDWVARAADLARFLLAELRREDGRLLRSWQAGRARHLAYAEDYAALLEALVTLAEVDDIRWLADAVAVADDLLRLFRDPEGGGFFTTGHDAEPLITRPKDVEDNATPAASSLAASGLLRLAALTGVASYEDPALEVVRSVAPVAARHPLGFGYLLGAYERAITPPIEVALVGSGAELAPLVAEVHGRLVPASVSVAAPPGLGADLTPLLADRGLLDERATAYVCERYACRRPVTDPEALRAELDDALSRRAH